VHAQRNKSVFFKNISTKSKTKVNFLKLKICKIWQIGNRYFTLVGACFSEISIRPVLIAVIKNTNLQKSKNLPLQTLLYLCLKFVSCWMWCAVKILEDFTTGNSRKSQKQKTEKTQFYLGIYISRLITQNFNTINHCLLHLISLRGLRVNTNVKTAFKT